MSNNLYEEAINAAEQIKEATETRVKQQLIEAMSPKIKEMIEDSYMSEDPQEEADVQEAYLEGDEAVEISSESVQILKNMIGKKQQKNVVNEKLESIREGINHLKKALIIAESSNKTTKFKNKFVYAFKNLLKELKNIKSNSIIKTDKTLLKEYLQLSKELNNMSRRRSSRSRYLNENLEELLEMNLFEEEVDEEEGMPEDFSDAEEEEEGMPEQEEGMMLSKEVSEMTLEELIGAVESSMPGSEDEGDDEEEDELDDELEEGLFYEVDETEVHEETEEESSEGVVVEEGLFLEIDENMLKREINNMRRIREGDEADPMASHFGGGKVEGESFVDGVELNSLGEGSQVSALKLESALRKAIAENRKLKSNTKQFKNALQGMKQQLSEMNLFNAKLLYANKLMQNRDLSMKQQRHVVESLDEAGTLNEAKLLFESLSKSLSRPSKKSGNLSESASRRNLGSSSRSVRSAQPLNEGLALDRWATLAGIKK